MEPNHYIETALVQNADADFRSLLKPSALLRYVEQVSADHARAFGMDDQFFHDHGVAFLVGKQALRMQRGAIKRITTAVDEAGAVVAEVDCRWILVNLETGHIMREPTWTTEGFWNETVDGGMDLHLHKCKEVTRAGEWTARYSQCDLNGHINNAFYLDIACDALPLEVVKQAPLRFASVSYHREVPLGQSMEVFYAPSAEGWYVVGRHEGRTSFECYLVFGA